MIENLQACLSFWQPPDATGEYARRMWRHTLDYHAAPEAARRDGSGALPYLPIDPEALGCRLSPTDTLLDVGCLGGYGLFDIAQTRRFAGDPLPRLIGVDQAASSIALAQNMAAHWTKAMMTQPQDTAATLTPDPSPSGRGENMAAHWTHGATADFLQADAERLPFPDKTCRVVVARLLLPYTAIDDTLRELTRVLATDGLLYLQVHGPRYYFRRFSKNYRKPKIAAYYLRPLLACAWLRLVGRQASGPLFRETALTPRMLRRLAELYDLSERWQSTDRIRPFAVYEKQ